MGLIDNISAELARLRRENDALRADLAELRAEREASLLVQRNASLALDEARSEIAELRADLASIRSVYDFAALEAKIAELRVENHDLRSSIITDLGPKLADVRAALKPFAAVGQWLFARPVPDDTSMVEFDGINGHKIVFTRGDFKAAHSALHASEQKASEKQEG